MNIDSTLEDLQLYDFVVEVNCSISEVFNNFKKHPQIPGVILIDSKKFIGIVSQKRFWQYMSLPFSLELSLKLSIDYVRQFINLESLVLSKDISIVEAAKKALKRAKNMLEEPVVVEIAPHEYRLLDIRQLLIAQAEIHELSNNLIMNLCKDIEKTNKKLKLLSSIDGLTQLANQRLFDEYLQEEWKKVTKEQSNISLIVGELDFLKNFNDNYGHTAGDDCLRQVARVIKQITSDRESLAARYGGDLFAILVPEIELDEAVAIAEAIRQNILALKIPNSGSEVSSYLTLSLGIASLIPKQDSSSPDSLFLAADRALSEAKRKGRNCVVVKDKSQTEIIG